MKSLRNILFLTIAGLAIGGTTLVAQKPSGAIPGTPVHKISFIAYRDASGYANISFNAEGFGGLSVNQFRGVNNPEILTKSVFNAPVGSAVVQESVHSHKLILPMKDDAQEVTLQFIDQNQHATAMKLIVPVLSNSKTGVISLTVHKETPGDDGSGDSGSPCPARQWLAQMDGDGCSTTQCCSGEATFDYRTCTISCN